MVKGNLYPIICLEIHGSSKIKGIDVSLKGISIDSKTIGPNQLDVVSKKQ